MKLEGGTDLGQDAKRRELSRAGIRIATVGNATSLPYHAIGSK